MQTSRNKRVLVIGDVMLDVFVEGEIRRISPEASVPVVLEKKRTTHLGGAGNAARNLAALGAQTTLVGIVGDDSEAMEVKRLASESNIRSYFIVDTKRPTTKKTRVLSEGAHRIRIDRESNSTLSKDTEKRLVQRIESLPHFDWVVVSDYAKGMLTKRVVAAIKRRFDPKRTTIDPKPKNATRFKRMGVVKLNLTEAHAICGIRATSHKQAQRTVRVLSRVFQSSIVLTRGEKGMTILDRETQQLLRIPGVPCRPRDVTGAGDTAAAVLSLELARGATLRDAASVANTAASIAVSRSGTAAISKRDILATLKKH